MRCCHVYQPLITDDNVFHKSFMNAARARQKQPVTASCAFVCVCRRSFLDLRDPGVLGSDQRQLVHLPQQTGRPLVPLQAAVPPRSVLLSDPL